MNYFETKLEKFVNSKYGYKVSRNKQYGEIVQTQEYLLSKKWRTPAGVANESVLGPWKKTFAFLPVKLDNGQMLWLKTYYKRKHGKEIQRGTVFDVLGDVSY